MPAFVGRDYSGLRPAVSTIAWFIFGDKPILTDEEINALLCGVAESDEFQVVRRRVEWEQSGFYRSMISHLSGLDKIPSVPKASNLKTSDALDRNARNLARPVNSMANEKYYQLCDEYLDDKIRDIVKQQAQAKVSARDVTFAEQSRPTWEMWNTPIDL